MGLSHSSFQIHISTIRYKINHSLALSIPRGVVGYWTPELVTALLTYDLLAPKLLIYNPAAQGRVLYAMCLIQRSHRKLN